MRVSNFNPEGRHRIRSTEELMEAAKMIEAAILAAAEVYEVPRPCIVLSRVRKCVAVRQAVMYLLRSHDMILLFISQAFNKHRSTVISGCRTHLNIITSYQKERDLYMELHRTFHAKLKEINANPE